MNLEYKIRLEEMLRQITAELQAIGIQNPHNPTDWIAVPDELDAEEPDENLSADAVEAWNERNALVADLEPRWGSMVRALARIELGTFGVCEICNRPIEDARLNANLVSRTCVLHVNDENTLTT